MVVEASTFSVSFFSKLGSPMWGQVLTKDAGHKGGHFPIYRTSPKRQPGLAILTMHANWDTGDCRSEARWRCATPGILQTYGRFQGNGHATR